MRKGSTRWFLIHPYPSMRKLRRGGSKKIQLNITRAHRKAERPFQDVITALRMKGDPLTPEQQAERYAKKKHAP